MGKRLIQQRRGRGSPTHRAPSFRYKGKVKHPKSGDEGIVTNILKCPGHSAPLMEVIYNQGEVALQFAAQGIKIGSKVSSISQEANKGNVAKLGDLVEGTLVHNLEIRPGDGGKLVRTSGTSARIVSKTPAGIKVLLPSKKHKIFHPECRAGVGVLAGSGRVDKPLLKAGNNYHKMRAKNKLYPRVCGVSMNAVDHPFGSGSSHTKGRPTQSPRSAPPGRKVGKIAPKRTGKKR